jgi:hypothetical protein
MVLSRDSHVQSRAVCHQCRNTQDLANKRWKVQKTVIAIRDTHGRSMQIQRVDCDTPHSTFVNFHVRYIFLWRLNQFCTQRFTDTPIAPINTLKTTQEGTGTMNDTLLEASTPPPSPESSALRASSRRSSNLVYPSPPVPSNVPQTPC